MTVCAVGYVVHETVVMTVCAVGYVVNISAALGSCEGSATILYIPLNARVGDALVTL